MRPARWLHCLIAATTALMVLSACSVGMALSGKQNPDLGAVRVGASRGEVELQLGSPIQSASLEDGRRADVYAYEIGNEPSAGRAIGHGVLDVLTLGIWEVAGTPIEGVQGEAYHATITYDQDEKVVNIKTNKGTAAM